jgi:hypothetical protein
MPLAHGEQQRNDRRFLHGADGDRLPARASARRLLGVGN